MVAMATQASLDINAFIPYINTFNQKGVFKQSVMKLIWDVTDKKSNYIGGLIM